MWSVWGFTVRKETSFSSIPSERQITFTVSYIMYFPTPAACPAVLGSNIIASSRWKENNLFSERQVTSAQFETTRHTRYRQSHHNSWKEIQCCRSFSLNLVQWRISDVYILWHLVYWSRDSNNKWQELYTFPTQNYLFILPNKLIFSFQEWEIIKVTWKDWTPPSTRKF